MRVNGKTADYYNTQAVSYGLQLGIQWFGYAMFFRTDEALGYLGVNEATILLPQIYVSNE